MIQYQQASGGIWLGSKYLGGGYSGYGAALNNPKMEAIPSNGPIPAGFWKIDRWDDHHGDKGPCVAVLSPVGHNARGRSAFLIHGDNSQANHTASHGCIIANRDIRQHLRDSGDMELEVI